VNDGLVSTRAAEPCQLDGNVMLPIGAGLILACGIYQFSKGQELERYIYGAMAALLGSGLLRLAEVISQQNGGADQYMVMLLTVTNFVGNVLMPFTRRSRLSAWSWGLAACLSGWRSAMTGFGTAWRQWERCWFPVSCDCSNTS